ncbi:hypothetical protein KCU92_g3925, partial [Aureobasidium melanogenum]
MDDQEGFINGDHSNRSVYNNPKDSDIILNCGGHHFHGHRVMLRLWSPFFERSLNSQFSVSSSTVFNIDYDDKDDHEYFAAMLKHIYGMPFGEEGSNDPYSFEFCSNSFENIIRVYMMADKYDFPAVRNAAVSEVENFLEDPDLSADDNPFEVPEWIAKICGPDASQLADPKLRDTLFRWVSQRFHVLTQDPEYSAKIEDGSLLDADLTTKLLFKLSTDVRYLKKKT